MRRRLFPIAAATSFLLLLLIVCWWADVPATRVRFAPYDSAGGRSFGVCTYRPALRLGVIDAKPLDFPGGDDPWGHVGLDDGYNDGPQAIGTVEGGRFAGFASFRTRQEMVSFDLIQLGDGYETVRHRLWDVTSHVVRVPYWFLAGLAALLPIGWVYTRARGRRRSRNGRCAGCGYDLRESPERCPECGTARPGPAPQGRARAALTNAKNE